MNRRAFTIALASLPSALAASASTDLQSSRVARIDRVWDDPPEVMTDRYERLRARLGHDPLLTDPAQKGGYRWRLTTDSGHQVMMPHQPHKPYPLTPAIG